MTQACAYPDLLYDDLLFEDVEDGKLLLGGRVLVRSAGFIETVGTGRELATAALLQVVDLG